MATITARRPPALDGPLGAQARALLASGYRAAAIGALFLAVEDSPRDAGLHAALADALLQEGQPRDALQHAQEAFRLEPSAAHATVLGCVLIDLGRDGEAFAIIERGLRRNPGCPALLLNRSIALEGLGRFPEALRAARRALAASPRDPKVQHHLAASLLIDGAMTAEAWRLYEGRLHLDGASVIPDHARRWTGGDIAGRTVLLHAEQGIGDTLQFVRYAPLVAALGARVVLAVQPSLRRLLEGTPGTEAVIGIGEGVPSFDLYAPLLSLPGLFGTTLQSIPPPLPYTIGAGRGPLRAGLRVGLAWAGNPGFVADRKRSMAPALLAPLAGIGGVTFHALQLGAGLPPGLGGVSLLDGVRDFADTAERIAALDLVITVDTAIAHLAATMGKPTWLLSRFRGCWRWLREREDSPWYPTIRLYRQARANDWEGVISRLRQDLVLLANGGRGLDGQGVAGQMPGPDAETTMTTFQVDGMTCNHCVAAVSGAIRAVDPAALVSVDLASGRVQVESAAGNERLMQAIATEGYTAAALPA